MRWMDDEAKVWGRKLLCHIPRLNSNLGLWLMTTMMIIFCSIVCENIDGEICVGGLCFS